MSRKKTKEYKNESGVGSRIAQLRNYLGISQDEFAKEIDQKRGSAAISSWETGMHEPRLSVIQVICSRFNVSRNWLLTGEGQMNVPSQTKSKSSSYPAAPENVLIFEPENEYHTAITEEEAKKYATMAYSILTSRTGYARALKENIIWFRNAVSGYHKMEELEERLKTLEDRLPKASE